jgi:hypothetical protein
VQQKLHIVCFDNPFPPSYGGVIDVFYKIKALHQIGVRITLHCFTSAEHKASTELRAVTEQVHFYPKVRNPIFLLSSWPFATRSRSSHQLAERLLTDDAPILFEGLQSSLLAFDPRLTHRRKFLRLHNLESKYYAGTAASEQNIFKKVLFKSESEKFLKLERHLSIFEKVFTLSLAENKSVAERFGNSVYLPVFHGNESVKHCGEFGEFALYHGDLRLPDNLRAAEFMVKVFKNIPHYNLVIASGSGRGHIEKLIKNIPNISFRSITDDRQLTDLLSDAHINVMISFQESGTKLKLINALYRSRHCLINENIADDSRIRELCSIASDVASFRDHVLELIDTPYLDFTKRQQTLDTLLNPIRNAESIKQVVWPPDINS